MSDSLLSLLATHLWQLTIVAGIMTVIGLLIRYRNPQLMHALWLVVLLKCLIPPIWTSPVGSPPLGTLANWTFEKEHRETETSVVATKRSTVAPLMTTKLATDFDANSHNDSETVAFSTTEKLPVAYDIPRVDVADSGETVTTTIIAPSVFSPVESYRPSITNLLVIAWAVGMAGVWLTALVRVRRLRKGSQPVSHSDLPELHTRVHAVGQRLGLRRTPLIRMSTNSAGPAVMGVFRPTLILPNWLLEFSDDKQSEQLDGVIAHELTHVRRGDLWLGCLQTLVVSMWWYHPLVWWASRQLSEQAELLCDESVVRKLDISPSKYARQVLRVLENASLQHSDAQANRITRIASSMLPDFRWVGPGMDAFSKTRIRMERIMTTHQRRWRLTTSVALGIGLLMAACVLPGASNAPAETPVDAPLTPATLESIHEGPTTPNRPTFTFQAENGNEATITLMPDAVVLPPQETPITAKVTKQTPSPTVMRTHDVSELLDQLEHEVPKRNRTAEFRVKLRQGLESRLQSCLQLLASPQDRVPSVSMGWAADVLHVFAAEPEHQFIESVLSNLGKHDLAQIVLSTRFLIAPVTDVAESSETVGIQWYLVPHRDDRTIQKTGAPDRHLNHPNPIVSLWSSSLTQQNESDMPLFVAFLDPKQSESWLQIQQGNSRTNLLHAPRVTVFDGTSASIADEVQRPFVTSLSGTPDGAEPHEPIIGIRKEGMDVGLLPHWLGQDQLSLSIRITHSKILDVDTIGLPIKGEYSSLQAPAIQREQLQTQLEMRTDQTVLLARFDTIEGRKNLTNDIEAVQICVINADVLTDLSENTAPLITLKATQAQRSKNRERLIALSRFPRLEDTPDAEEVTKTDSEPQVVSLPSDMQALLQSHSTQVMAKGLMSFQRDENSKIKLSANEIVFAGYDAVDEQRAIPEIQLTSSEMIIQTTKEAVRVQCTKRLEFDMGGSFKIEADSANLDFAGFEDASAGSFGLTLEGNVKSVEEDGARATADRMRVDSTSMIWEGNAKLRLETSEGKFRDVEGDRIEVDYETDMIIVEREKRPGGPTQPLPGP